MFDVNGSITFCMFLYGVNGSITFLYGVYGSITFCMVLMVPLRFVHFRMVLTVVTFCMVLMVLLRFVYFCMVLTVPLSFVWC